MKTSLLVLLAGMLMPGFSYAAVQVEIKDLLFPEGYDSNDNIEIVIDGTLPNACYQLARTEVKKTGRRYVVRQFAELRAVSGCEDQTNIPPKLDWPTSYSTVVNLGILDEGAYRIAAPKHLGEDSIDHLNKELVVVKAQRNDVDDFMYAPITRAFMPELIYEGPQTQVVLSGVLGTTCLSLDPVVEMRRNGNVIVLLPKLIESPKMECVKEKRPIEVLKSLGELRPGRYLLHVRSTVGKAVNRTFTVISDPVDPSSRN